MDPKIIFQNIIFVLCVNKLNVYNLNVELHSKYLVKIKSSELKVETLSLTSTQRSTMHPSSKLSGTGILQLKSKCLVMFWQLLESTQQIQTQNNFFHTSSLAPLSRFSLVYYFLQSKFYSINFQVDFTFLVPSFFTNGTCLSVER